MKRISLLLVLLCIAIASYGQKVSGRVVDAESGEALAAASVYSDSQGLGVATNVKGYFELPVPRGTSIDLTVTYIGFKKQVVNVKSGASVTVRLKRGQELEEVQVYGARRDFGVNASQMSAQLLTAKQVKEVPALFGEVDVMKALQKLPGVQSGQDGTAGIYVRGGGYDQNLITLDGSTLYNGEHLKGFVSSVNSEMIDNVVMYKGAFPARYGSRLSSVIDMGVRDGNFQDYHAGITVGLLSSKIHAEGPIWKGHTSFNFAARASYFDLLVHPVLNKVYDNKKALEPYAKMNFYDINAKLAHRFSDRDKLSFVFYWGKDVSNSSPTDSEYTFNLASTGETKIYNSNSDNNWANLVSSLYWTHSFSDKLMFNLNASYSLYDYHLQQFTDDSFEEYKTSAEGGISYRIDKSMTTMDYKSKVADASLAADFTFRPTAAHDLHYGLKVSLQQLSPIIGAYNEKYVREEYNGGITKEYQKSSNKTIGEQQDLVTAAVYAEDDWTLTSWLKANIGLRYSLFSVKNKSYSSVEPRASLRFLLTQAMAFKLSYARMSQGLQLLTNSNLIMPSDIWVPATENVPVMKSNQYGAGLNYEIQKGFDVSVEGYYKTMDNLLEYRNGVSFLSNTGDWQDLVTIGRGRAYGVELMAQRTVGNTTGWVSYTWSKSLRTFDQLEQALNGGKEFLAANDKRHNFNVVIVHKFGRHWELSASWTYQSGRRGNLATTSLFAGTIREYDNSIWFPSSSSYDEYYMQVPDESEGLAGNPVMYTTYRERNNYKLPDVHHLDIGATYSLKHRKFGESEINLTLYNVYNQQNISSVYMGLDGKKYVLKGICMFPFMPSLTYTFKF